MRLIDRMNDSQFKSYQNPVKEIQAAIQNGSTQRERESRITYKLNYPPLELWRTTVNWEETKDLTTKKNTTWKIKLILEACCKPRFLKSCFQTTLSSWDKNEAEMAASPSRPSNISGVINRKSCPLHGPKKLWRLSGRSFRIKSTGFLNGITLWLNSSFRLSRRPVGTVGGD